MVGIDYPEFQFKVLNARCLTIKCGCLIRRTAITIEIDGGGKD